MILLERDKMKLFIDTSQPELMIAFFDNDFQVIKYQTSQLKEKVELMLAFFQEIDQSFWQQVNQIYINLGPGSFTGCRIALLYVRTWSQIKNIPIFTCSIFDLLKAQKQHPNQQAIAIHATAKKSYLLEANQLFLVDKKQEEEFLDYLSLIYNFVNYLSVFKQTKIEDLKPIYGSNPQINFLKK